MYNVAISGVFQQRARWSVETTGGRGVMFLDDAATTGGGSENPGILTTSFMDGPLADPRGGVAPPNPLNVRP